MEFPYSGKLCLPSYFACINEDVQSYSNVIVDIVQLEVDIMKLVDIANKPA